MPKSLHAASKQNYNNNDSEQIIRRMGQNVSYPIPVCYSQESVMAWLCFAPSSRQRSLASIFPTFWRSRLRYISLLRPRTLLKKTFRGLLTHTFLLFSYRSRRFPQQGLTYPMIFTSLQETGQISS